MSNSNATVAIPGSPNWAVWWTWQSGFESFQLDIVGFLAILGEANVLDTAQVAGLSWISCLPRIMPAPGALIRSKRSEILPRSPDIGNVTGIYFGTPKHFVDHPADVLLDHARIPTHGVRCVTVERRQRPRIWPGIIDTVFRGAPGRPKFGAVSVIPSVLAKATGPMLWVSMLGVIQLLMLFACSIALGDGMSILATILLGGLSTVVGMCNKWSLKPWRITTLPTEEEVEWGPTTLKDALKGDAPKGDAPKGDASKGDAPKGDAPEGDAPKGIAPKGDASKGDVVVRYPNGSYMIVKCNEDVARELFCAPPVSMDYSIKHRGVYRSLCLLGTLMLMMGVIALANAKLQLQCAWAIAYIMINFAYWVAATLPGRWHWDLSGYTVEESSVHMCDGFTDALWQAIWISGSTAWVGPNRAMPKSPPWPRWLHEADESLREGDSQWDSKGAWFQMNEDYNSEMRRHLGSSASLRQQIQASAQ